MLHAVDYLVLAGVLFLSLGIGVYQSRTGGHQRTRAEFIFNNHQLRVVPTVLSWVVSYQSAISVMSSSAEYYQWGTPMWLCGELMAFMGIIVVERLILPTFYPLDCNSIYEYFVYRYGNHKVKYVVSFLGIFKSMMYTGVTVLAPSIALQTLTGFPLQAAIILMAGICALYTSLGGLRAVIWTDVLQCFIMVTGLLVLLVSATIEVGSLGKVFQIGVDEGRVRYGSFVPDPRKRITFYNSFVTFIPVGMIVFGLEQASYQRYSGMPSLAKARLSVLLLVPCYIIYMSLCYIVGACIFPYFVVEECDPFAAGYLKSPNQIVPYFVKSYLRDRIGGQGLFLAVLYSASLSSVSSILSGVAANTWEDHIKPRLPHVSERKAALANRLLVVVFACVTIGLAIICSALPGNLLQIFMTINGGLQGPVFGVFLLSFLTRRTDWKGALIGCFTGMAVVFWIALCGISVPGITVPLHPLSTEGCEPSFNSTLPKYVTTNATTFFSSTPGPFIHKGVNHLYAISFMWFIPLGACVTFIAGLIASEVLRALGKHANLQVDDKYLVSFKNMFSCKGDDTASQSVEVGEKIPLGAETESRQTEDY